MTIYSANFFVFFITTFIAYYVLPKKFQQYIVLLASLFFIYSLSVKILVYTLVFGTINYFTGIILEKHRGSPTGKIIYWWGLLFNIGILVFYKYFNFLIDNVNAVGHLFTSDKVVEHINILVLIGVSYYTFQGIGYVIQINRKLESAHRNFIEFINFMIFFPKFIAGPIERSKKFLPQLSKTYDFDYNNIVFGLRLILWGAFKKLVIGDRLAEIVNTHHAQLDSASGFIFMLVFLIQPLHLYFDFSGYTNIALGIGRLFGFQLTDNFNRPFFAKTVGEFWKRWHISLSAWCNDFIFNRIILKRLKWKKWASIYAVFITFFVIGIWHGSKWTYVVVGILQGIAINYEFLTKRKRIEISKHIPEGLNIFLSILFTYLYFCLTLVFFNSYSLAHAGVFLSKLFASFSLEGIGIFGYTNYAFIILGSAFILVLEYLEEFKKVNLFEAFTKQPKVLRWGIYFLLTFLVLYQSGQNSSFVYMQF